MKTLKLFALTAVINNLIVLLQCEETPFHAIYADMLEDAIRAESHLQAC